MARSSCLCDAKGFINPSFGRRCDQDVFNIIIEQQVLNLFGGCSKKREWANGGCHGTQEMLICQELKHQPTPRHPVKDLEREIKQKLKHLKSTILYA
jgi:hypothetical protein